MAGTDELTLLAGRLSEELTLPDEPVAVALSGGADSAALLWMVSRALADVVAIHVIHGLPASALMSTAAGQVAAMCGVPLQMVVVEPPGSAEHHLRDVRLAALLEQAGDRPVLFGHTQDDQAETVLLRVLRGTGVEGMAGMTARRGRVHHPILHVRRNETRRLAELAGLPFRDDPANDDPGVVRNRLRSELLPLAADIMGRDVGPLIARLADNVRDSLPATTRVRFETDGDRLRAPVGELMAASDAFDALRRAIAEWGDGYPPSRAALLRVGDVVSGSAASTELEGGVRVVRRDGFLILDRGGRPPPSAGAPPGTITEGVTAWGGWRFVAAIIEGPTVVPLSRWRTLVPDEAERLEVRAGAAEDSVVGRRFDDALADARVAAADRDGWPIVTRAGEPVWIPGVRRRSWPGHGTGRYLSITASREPLWQTFEP